MVADQLDYVVGVDPHRDEHALPAEAAQDLQQRIGARRLALHGRLLDASFRRDLG